MSGNVLIAYFSHEGEAYAAGTIVTLKIGNTRVAAEMMAEMTGADLHRIETVHPYPFSHMETVEIAQKEQKQNARPELQPTDLDMASYDTIILGYPTGGARCLCRFSHFLNSMISVEKQSCHFAHTKAAAWDTAKLT